jgi:hypothetical protein
VKILLDGGLGNQLFQISAGLYFQNVKGQKVQFQKYENYNSNSNKLSNFILVKRIYDGTQNLTSRTKVGRLIHRCNRFLSTRSTPINKINLYFFKNYFITEIGYESNLMKHNNEGTIYGYFQTYKFASKVRNSLIDGLQLINKSKQYDLFEKKLNSNKIITVHIRRGDFIKEIGFRGLLSGEYYANAISVAKKHLPKSEVWLFSDDKEACQALIKKTNLDFSKTIYKDSNLTDEETLHLISLGACIITANSTFSWWSAFLAKAETLVIAPKQWFYSKSNPKNLYPNHWVLLDSKWE